MEEASLGMFPRLQAYAEVQIYRMLLAAMMTTRVAVVAAELMEAEVGTLAEEERLVEEVGLVSGKEKVDKSPRHHVLHSPSRPIQARELVLRWRV